MAVKDALNTRFIVQDPRVDTELQPTASAIKNEHEFSNSSESSSRRNLLRSQQTNNNTDSNVYEDVDSPQIPADTSQEHTHSTARTVTELTNINRSPETHSESGIDRSPDLNIVSHNASDSGDESSGTDYENEEDSDDDSMPIVVNESEA